MAPRSTITPKEAAELQRLYAVYNEASMRAAEAMRTGGAPLVGPALQRVLDEDTRAGRAMQRIKEIYGV
jgi:hypothetical protein